MCNPNLHSLKGTVYAYHEKPSVKMKQHLMLFSHNLNTYLQSERLICLFILYLFASYSEVVKNYDLTDDKPRLKPGNSESWRSGHHGRGDMYVKAAPATAARENLNSQVNHDYREIIQI